LTSKRSCVCVDADDLVPNLLGLADEQLFELRVAHHFCVIPEGYLYSAGGRLPIGFESGCQLRSTASSTWTADKLKAILAQVAGEENSTLTPRDEDEGLGFGFFLKLAGVCVVGGILVLILFLIFWRAVYAWGLFGAFLVLAAGLSLFGWLWDRRNART
jgi:hypothetical protein